MRLAMVIGEQRLAMEQRMLNRLAVGLTVEGVQVIRIVPEGLPASLIAEGERRMALAPRFEARLRSLRWTRRVHIRRLAEALADNVPDALYLLGRDAWAFGLDLATELDRPAILEAWSASQAASLPRPASNAHLAAVTAPCEGIAKVVRERVGADLTAIVPLGASPPRRATQVLDGGQPPAVAILGGARDVAAYAVMLNGLARVIKEHTGLQIVIELRGPHEHDIWRVAERSGLIGAVSAIGSASQHQALLTRCDLVILPEHYGELRSVLLDVMAMSVPVVAAADPALDMLIDGVTARLVSSPSANAWADAVSTLLATPEQARALGAGGRERIIAAHRSSDQVARMMDLLQRLAGRSTLVFPGQAG